MLQYKHGASETTAALEFAVNSLQARIFFHMAFIFLSSHACDRSFVAKYPVLKQLCSFVQVPNVLVVGHSRCGGIQALMSMKSKKDDRSSRYNSLPISPFEILYMYFYMMQAWFVFIEQNLYQRLGLTWEECKIKHRSSSWKFEF